MIAKGTVSGHLVFGLGSLVFDSSSASNERILKDFKDQRPKTKDQKKEQEPD
jgi:hypothetical protein